MRVRLGIEELPANGLGTRVGLLTHPAAVRPDLHHGLDALLDAGAPITAVFGAEHGFRGTAQAGESEGAGVDAVTGLPVFDTYTRTAAEIATMLTASGIDTLVIDLQHVGARFYTYESTLYDAIAAAATANVRVIVTDRPNPIGGVVVDGPVLQPPYASFVGRAPIAMRHGMTMGELARMFADLLAAPAPTVIAMRGWQRPYDFVATGLPWVPPSPNVPTATTAAIYAGTCLFEGVNVSEGRGTTTPFEVIGAPWLDRRLATHVRSLDLPGAAFRDVDFTPAFAEFAGVGMHGVAIHITDASAFDPIRVAVTLLTAIERHSPGAMTFRPTFDRLAGTDGLRTAITAHVPADDIIASWQTDLRAFAEVRSAYLIY